MPRFEVTFAATIEATEIIEAETLIDAIALAETLAEDHEVGEHKLNVDWEIDSAKQLKESND